VRILQIKIPLSSPACKKNQTQHAKPAATSEKHNTFGFNPFTARSVTRDAAAREAAL
jgi:hypothetical protein